MCLIARAIISITRAPFEGKQYPIFCRKKGSLDAPEEIILDQNELAKGQKFMTVGAFSPSDDGNSARLLNRQYRLSPVHAADQRPAHRASSCRRRSNALTMSPGPPTTRRFFYVTEDAVSKRSDKFFRHVLGTERTI